MSNIDINLINLAWKDLIKLADYHDKQATICRARAQSICDYEHMENEIDDRIKKIWSIPKHVVKFLRRGHDLETAQGLVAEYMNAPLPTVHNHWKRFIREKSGEMIRERNRLIIHLVKMGLSNKEIGVRVDLHPNSVSRIISKSKRYSRIDKERPENRNIYLFRQEEALRNQKLLPIKKKAI